MGGWPTQTVSSNLPFYLRDSNDFLEKIEDINNKQPLPPETLLVTWDVKSLYANIPHKEGMKACEHYMRQDNFSETKIDTMLTFTELALKCNNLTFQGQHYIQQTGTAMGTKMAPTYANLYMGQLAAQLQEQTTLKPLVWFRLIDDIFSFCPLANSNFSNFLNSATVLIHISCSNRQCYPQQSHSLTYRLA